MQRISFLKPAYLTIILSVQVSLAVSQTLPPVAPVDLSLLNPSDFLDEELDIPYYLKHFHRLANSVQDTGEYRGFITLDCWRTTRNQKTYNARIMENCLSLVFFYCTDRPWNLYYGDPVLRQRLEVALEYWCNMQSPDGHFSEYGVKKWSLAPTAFGVKFMSEALVLLADGPQIDATIHRRVVDATAKAIRIVLTDPALYAHGKRFSNQYTNIFAGGLAFLSVHPNKELETLLVHKLKQSQSFFQSPAGYFYEKDGPDWRYNLATHHSNLFMAYHYSPSESLRQHFIDEQARYIEWLSYNALWEPGTNSFLLNRAIETRQSQGSIVRYGPFLEQDVFLGQEVPLASSFLQTKAEVAKAYAKRRATLEANWPQVPELIVGDMWSFTPYRFLNRKHPDWYPTETQRISAMKQLPMLNQQRFIHLRCDTRKLQQFTYIRRSYYYAAFNTGEKLTSKQRFGLGVVWTPQMGTILQSQSGSQTLAWGTYAQDADLCYEAGSLHATLHLDEAPVSLKPGTRDIKGDNLMMHYLLGEQGQKEIHFLESEIRVRILHQGPFVEKIPLILDPRNARKLSEGMFSYQCDQGVMHLEIDPEIQPEFGTFTVHTVDGKQLVPLLLKCRDKLDYVIRFRKTPQE